MKHTLIYLLILFLCLSLSGCTTSARVDIAVTTAPVYTFASRICANTPLSIGQLVTEDVSCLHDYSLQVRHMQMIQSADVVILSGAGLEDFMHDALHGTKVTIDASSGLSLMEGTHHHHDHEHDHTHGHIHSEDPHIWLSPQNAKTMARNIFHGLEALYPQYSAIFEKNYEALVRELDALLEYGNTALSSLRCRELITFHDGFAYLAECFDLTILEAVEEESGSEASAAQLIHIIELVREHQLPAVFTERNGSVSAAEIIGAETKIAVYALDMAMGNADYFEAMYHNINTLTEALK